jgi:hypothetical protein
MALQQINWLQIDTSNVPSGSIVDLGASDKPLHGGYFENLYISGQTVQDLISIGGAGELNTWSASIKTALETTGSNLTVKGNLLVLGTTTSINSNTIQLGDNIIELNGNGQMNGGLIVRDPTAPNTISGSLLWDSTGDYWKAGPAGSEQKIITQKSGSGNLNYIQKSSGSGVLTDSRIYDDGTNVIINTTDTGSILLSGSVTIKGNLRVEGTTTLVQTLDPNIESLVVSGAMSIVENHINAQIVSASIKMQNIILAEHKTNVNIIDCGDGFF